MPSPILFISDTHYHNFTQYAQLDAQGRNTRLMDILRATGEAVAKLRAAGGNTVMHGGDMFHVRGSISPTVLNPVLDFYRKLVKAGLDVYVISGNHDLETNDADELSSTVTALREVGVRVINEPTSLLIEGEVWHFVPWVPKLDDLRRIIQTGVTNPSFKGVRANLVIHAPMNGVIDGLPDHGLSTKDFEGTPWKSVFIGHYHHHKVFPFNAGESNAFSIGALTHQNWGDAQSQAGYMLYWGDPKPTYSHFRTNAPRFVKVSVADLETFEDATDNYIKVTDGEFTDPADIEAIRNDLILKGAKAVIVEGLVKRPAVTRTGVSKGSAPTLQDILGDYVDRHYPGEPQVKVTALELLGEAYD